MSLDLYASDLADMPAAPAARPLDFGDGFSAAWTENQRFVSTAARERLRAEVLSERVDALQRATGEVFPQFDTTKGFAHELVRRADAEYPKIKARHRDKQLPSLAGPDIDAEVARRAGQARRARLEAEERPYGLAGAAGLFFGDIAGGATDPINVIGMSLGANPAAGILRTALIEGAIGLGSQSVVETFTGEFKREADPEYGAADALANIGMAGAGGAIIGGGARSLGVLWSKLRGRGWPRTAEDAGNVVMRDADAEASTPPTAAPGAEAAAHRTNLDAAEQALATNEPVDVPLPLTGGRAGQVFTVGPARGTDEPALPEAQRAFPEPGENPGTAPAPDSLARPEVPVEGRPAAAPTRVFDAENRAIDVRYELVEARDLVTSNLDDFSVNPAYPPELQPRDRTRAANQEQVFRIAADLEPERLGPSPDAATGAPIVGPDDVVESGNGRVMALRRVYAGEDVAPAVARDDGFTIDAYHGSPRAFEAFDPKLLGFNTDAPSAKQAFFFARDSRTANAYTIPDGGDSIDNFSDAQVARIDALRAQLKEIAERGGDARAERAIEDELRAITLSAVPEGWGLAPTVSRVRLRLQNPLVHDFQGAAFRDISFDDLLLKARAEGHDGAIFKNVKDGGPVDDIYAVFDPAQVRSRYDRGPGFGAGITRADAYRSYLRSQGYDVSGFDQPMLIARRTSRLTDAERVAVTTAANRATAMRLSPAEQALADARLIDDGLVDLVQPGEPTSAGNRNFIRAFADKLPQAERGPLFDAEGVLSQEGARRVTAALLARAYGDPLLLGRLLEDADSNMRAIGGAMADTAGVWASMRSAVTRGELPQSMDITRDLLDAFRVVARARDSRRPIRELVDQGEMFERPSAVSRMLLGFMFRGDDLAKPAGRPAMREALESYVDAALKNTTDVRLFGEPLEAPDVLSTALRSVGRADLVTLAQQAVTPAAIERAIVDPQVDAAVLADLERLQAGPDAPPTRMVPLDAVDASGAEVISARALDELIADADADTIAALELRNCALGSAATAAGSVA